MTDVESATGETTQSANQVTTLASDLSAQAGKLRQDIESFLSSVKAA